MKMIENENEWKWMKMTEMHENECKVKGKWMTIYENGWKLMNMNEHDWKWMKMKMKMNENGGGLQR